MGGPSRKASTGSFASVCIIEGSLVGAATAEDMAAGGRGAQEISADGDGGDVDGQQQQQNPRLQTLILQTVYSESVCNQRGAGWKRYGFNESDQSRE